MLYFTKYAEKKFEILNKHQVFVRREQVEEAVKLPDKTAKKGNYISVKKDNLKVVCDKKAGVTRIITFYPTKN